jgi:hypothetical protein
MLVRFQHHALQYCEAHAVSALIDEFSLAAAKFAAGQESAWALFVKLAASTTS